MKICSPPLRLGSQTPIHPAPKVAGFPAIFDKTVFDDFLVNSTETYKKGEELPEGSFKIANINFAGHHIVIHDSPPVHKFSFTPSISLTIDFKSLQKIENALENLSKDGKIMMPLDNYGFSQKFAWVEDKFGVSWQLNLP